MTRLALLAGLVMLAVGILHRGFFTLNENEVAVVVEYELGELVGEPLNKLVRGRLEDFRADLIAIINEQHSGGKTRIVWYDDPSILPFLTPYGKLYWHLPPPFGKHHKINLELHDYHLIIPLIVPVAFDQEGRPLIYYVLTPDVDGDPLTEDPGFRFISAHDLFEIQFSPEVELPVMMLDVKGRFKITSLERYALWVRDSYGQMDKLIKEYGIFGEMVMVPYGDRLIEAYLSSILDIYVWRVRYPELLEMAQQRYSELPPQALDSVIARFMMEDPETLTDGFVDFLSSPEFVEMTGIDLEGGVGIDVLEEIFTGMYEGAL
jgi:hypothetical protein